MILTIEKAINEIREKYNITLAQFGEMVGAPAVSIKRWKEGLTPTERYKSQIYLVCGLIANPDSVYFDLGRQGLKINKSHWESFASLIKSAQQCSKTAEDLGLEPPEINCAIVSGVKGLLWVIAKSMAPKKHLETVPALLVKNIGDLLFPKKQ